MKNRNLAIYRMRHNMKAYDELAYAELMELKDRRFSWQGTDKEWKAQMDYEYDEIRFGSKIAGVLNNR